MKALSLTFKGSLGKTHSLKLNYANDNLDATAVKNTMDTMASLGLFQNNGEVLYTQPVSAKYVETIETPVFDAEEEQA